MRQTLIVLFLLVFSTAALGSDLIPDSKLPWTKGVLDVLEVLDAERNRSHSLVEEYPSVYSLVEIKNGKQKRTFVWFQFKNGGLKSYWTEYMGIDSFKAAVAIAREEYGRYNSALISKNLSWFIFSKGNLETSIKYYKDTDIVKTKITYAEVKEKKDVSPTEKLNEVLKFYE
jgi:hypothetical protein